MTTDKEKIPIVFYDGDCQLCALSVQRILKYEKHEILQFAPLGGSTYLEKLGARYDQEKPDSLLVYTKDKVLRESAAFFEIVPYLRRPMSLIGIFRILPRFVTDAIYRMIGRNRYSWFGKVKQECMIYSDNKRFLE